MPQYEIILRKLEYKFGGEIIMKFGSSATSARITIVNTLHLFGQTKVDVRMED